MRLVIDKEANVHLNNLKRTIKNYMKQRGKENVDEIRISWKDLTSEETKGRWWLIGSGWSRASSGVIGGSVEQEAPVNINMNEFDAKLLEVARKQRMNTDVRRAIFCIVMGSEDYLDAFEKLVRLGLKNKQEREIVFVIIHCCSMEKKFNPFYAHLAMKLCAYSHNFKFTFKFTFWDKFKDFENLQLRAISNLANLLAQLIGHHVLSLSILKVVAFESIEPKAIVFFKIFMVSLMNDFEVETVMAVFQRLASAPKTKQLKEGLDLFFMQIFTKTALSQIADEAQRKREDRASKVAKMARKAMRDKQVSLF
jgi:nucleolar MIF4G domain-containing protein 1